MSTSDKDVDIAVFGHIGLRNMRDRISVNPKIHFGKPCVTGTRITVQNVLELVRDGVSFESIVADYYSDLTVEDVKACVQYAMDVVAVEDIHVSTLTP
jgi:uncharacterized protein (DUF433 family)